ncbi:uncharacterized protein LOC115220686 [Octopus sinensis]|uniref:Uncharacterized protein LOC115220686 n=1 Tax=Octopus sinensis TaxID=2607531 RepID=A0A6P7T730_9MOLL|nr:uncharacterized protein LOC115220686 [Octopus sinensis]
MNYRGITLTPIVVKIYNAFLLNRIQPQIERVLKKNQNGLRKTRSTSGQILTVRRMLEGVRAKNLNAVLLFVDFSKAFDSVRRDKMAEIITEYGIPDETINASRSRKYPAACLSDTSYTDDRVLFTDSTKATEHLLHLLENAAANIRLYVNEKKTEFITLNTSGEIRNIKQKPLKNGSNIMSPEKDIKSCIAKAWAAKDGLRTIWKDGLRTIWKDGLRTILGSERWS